MRTPRQMTGPHAHCGRCPPRGARSALRAAARALSGHMIASVHRYLPGASGKTARNRAPRSSCCRPLCRTSARPGQRCHRLAEGPAAAYKAPTVFLCSVRAETDRSGGSIGVRSGARALQDVVLPLALAPWTSDALRCSRRPIASPPPRRAESILLNASAEYVPAVASG